MAAHRRSVFGDPVTSLCCLAWCVPAIVAVTRAIRTGWYPVSDQALIAVGARDVLTGHHRLIGTAASVSFRGVLANHPGPLQFDLVALPVRLFGSGAGLALGVAVVNLGAGVVAIIAAARQAGRGGAAATSVGLLLLVWSAGNQALIDPYNPTAVMVPFFAVLILAWATVNEDRWALPWLVGWATLCIQANIAYVVTTVPIVVGAVGVYMWRRRGRGALRDIVVWCLPVGLVLWAQPLVEQVAGGREGNLARIVRNTSNLQEPLGLVDGTKRTAAVLAMWPGWGRGNFDGGDTGIFDRLPSLALSLLSLGALVAVLTACSVLSWRWLHERSLATLPAAAAVFVAIGWIGAVRVPLSPFYGFLAHFVRWLWPIGAVTVVAVGLVAGRVAQRVLDRRAVDALTLAVGLVAVVLATPYGPPSLDSDRFDRNRPMAVELNELATQRLPSSGVTVDFRPPTYSPFAFALVAALHEHGVPFAVTDGISLRQFDDRAPPAGSAWPTVFIATGFEALDRWDGAVACVSPLDDTERAQLQRDRSALAHALGQPGFSLSEVGTTFADSFLAPTWMADMSNGVGRQAAEIADSQQFADLLELGLIVAPSSLTEVGDHFVRLRQDLEDTTACVVEG